MANPISGKEVVTVDFANDLGPATQRACGFLHAMSADLPADELIFPLKPKMFRMRATPHLETGGAFACYERVTRLGATLQLVISDSQGCGRKGWWPGDEGDWSRWEDLVAELVGQAAQAGARFHWDIWNEPDIPQFWNPTPKDATATWNRFKETWIRGYTTIRTMDPDAVIVGPSTSRFSGNLFSVTDFLAFAAKEGVLPDILAWHEWNPATVIPHVNEARSFMETSGIPEIPISINEYVHHSHQTKPGILVHYFAAFEETGVESAAHACWFEPDKKPICWLAILDGILTPGERGPRSTWWAYRRYADITGRLLKIQHASTVQGVGAYNSETNEACLLFGRNGDATGEVEIVFDNLVNTSDLPDHNNNLRVTVEQIPDSGWDPLVQPTTIMDQNRSVADEQLAIMLPSLNATSACYVRLSRPND
jgi:hypothetical protein